MNRGVSKGGNTPKVEFIKPDDHALYFKLINLIIERDYDQFYEVLLYEGGSTLLHSLYQPEQTNLLHYAALANDHIAFDILLLFGATVDINWVKRFSEKLNATPKPITENINDRILGLLSNSYFPPDKDDIFDKIKKPRRKERPKKLAFQQLEIDLTPVYAQDETLDQVYQALFTDPEFAKLVAQATAQNPYKVRFIPQANLYSYAECDYWSNEVHLSEAASLFHKFTGLIIELSNAANHELRANLEKGYGTYQDENDYAYHMEKSEFLSTKRVIGVIRSLCENPQIMATLEDCEIFASDLCYLADGYDCSFEEYWITANEKLEDKHYPNKGYSHADYYRKAYRQWKTFQTISESKENVAPKEDAQPAITPTEQATLSLVPTTSMETTFTKVSAIKTAEEATLQETAQPSRPLPAPKNRALKLGAYASISGLVSLGSYAYFGLLVAALVGVSLGILYYGLASKSAPPRTVAPRMKQSIEGQTLNNLAAVSTQLKQLTPSTSSGYDVQESQQIAQRILRPRVKSVVSQKEPEKSRILLKK